MVSVIVLCISGGVWPKYIPNILKTFFRQLLLQHSPMHGMGHYPGIEYSVLQCIVPDCIRINPMRNIVAEVDAIHETHLQSEFSEINLHTL